MAAQARLKRTVAHLLPRRVGSGGAAVATGTADVSRELGAAGRRPPHPPPKGDFEGFGAPGLTTKPLDPPYLEPRSLTRDQDLPGAESLGLTAEEAAFFREKGYIVKRNLIPLEELKPFEELWWEQPPVTEAGLRRDDPQTWVAPGKRWPKENRWGTENIWMGTTKWPCNVGEAAHEPRPGGTVGEKIMRTPYNLDCAGHVWRWHGIGHDEDFVRATSAHPKMLHMIEALMGGPVRRPRRNRGIYTVFPREKATSMGPHHDGGGCGELMAVTPVMPVLPRSGGFTIWPGSHRLFYETSEQALNWVPTERSKEVMNRVKATVEPVEFCGNPGDVIFCSGQIMHSAGIQESTRLRLAVIMEFNKVRERGPLICKAAGKHGGPGAACGRDGVFQFPTDDPEDDPADGEREVTTQWHIDGNEYAKDQTSPKDHGDMFADWNLGQRPVMGDIVEEPAWWEKYNIRVEGPRGGGGMAAVPLSSIATYEGEGRWRLVEQGNGWREKR